MSCLAFEPGQNANQSSDSKEWFAIRVRSNFETSVSGGLRARQMEEFLPLYRARRRWSDRVRTVELPLFPGYVFCRFNASNRLPVLATPGVVSIVGAGNRPLPIDESEISAIQALVESGMPTEPWPFLRVGQRVRLAEGPLAGIEGIVAEMSRKCRLVVSVMMLQRSVSVEISRDWIRPV